MRSPLRLPNALLLIILVTTGLLAGCDDAPSAPEAADGPAAPSLAISDAAHGGTGGFHFLPPLVPDPTTTGTFDGAQAPVVRVCVLVSGTCGVEVARFSGSRIVVDPVAESYQVDWKTKGAGLSSATPYRLEVLVGATVLGHADLAVVASGSQKKGIDRGQFVTVIDGSTLPIRFRIGNGAVPPPPQPGGPWQPGAATTYGQGIWDGDVDARTLLTTHYDAVYAPTSGVLAVGFPVPLTTGFTMAFTNASALIAFLPGIGASGPLTSDLLNPAVSPAGVFAGDVIALELNVEFADAGLLPGTTGVLFGDFVLCGFDALPQLDGLTVRQLLALANTLLGGGSGPYGIAEVVPVLAELNVAFFGGTVVSDFAQEHLVLAACP